MLTPLHSPAQGRLRVAGFATGSGNTFWQALELQREMAGLAGGCPFEAAAIFTGRPGAACLEKAKALGVPAVILDMDEFYRRRGRPLKDMETRADFDRRAIELLEPYEPDIIILAGYVWAVTDALLERYTVINVHPADLSIVLEGGRRAYAGPDGVGEALRARENYLRSSCHLVNSELDAGPLLLVSEKVPVDYSLDDDDETRRRRYLQAVNRQSRLVGARALLETAQGHFARDAEGRIYHRGQPIPGGLRIEKWTENIPLFRRRTEKLMKPDSVAVIGASAKGGLGHSVVRNLLGDGFPGPVYAVNGKGDEVLGVPGFASVGDIPREVDMAILAVPSGAALEVAEACGRKGVSAVVCLTAGFKEMGGAGLAEEKKLAEIVDRYNMRLIGPNCMGLVVGSSRLNATMIDSRIAEGGVAMVTQSGSLGAAILDSAASFGLGFSAVVSLGNQMDVGPADLLPMLEADPNTKVIFFYLETFTEPDRFCEAALRTTKPILALKSGRTAFGALAASSHTGSLAGNDSLSSALLARGGIRRVQTAEEACAAALALSRWPHLKGDRTAILTNAGGPGILMSDALYEAGFQMPPLPEYVQARLAPLLLPEASVKNPVDVVAAAKPEHYSIAIKAIMGCGAYDALLICCVPPSTVDTGQVGEACAEAVGGGDMPVIASFFGPSISRDGREALRRRGLPVFEFPEQAVTALAALRKPPKFPFSRRPAAVPAEARRLARRLGGPPVRSGWLPVSETAELLNCFAIKTLKSVLIRSEAEIPDLKLRFPVAAKIDHPQIIHKSDVGGVKLDLAGPAELAAAVSDFRERFPSLNGTLAQEMAPQGLELIVGSIRDPLPLVMLGLGGVWTEVVGDVTFGYPPISEELAQEMISGLKCLPLLRGYRGAKGVNTAALARLLGRVGDLVRTLPGIAELDLNPVIYDPAQDDFTAVDFRVRLA